MRSAQVYWDEIFWGQPGSVSKFPLFWWVKLWVGWVDRGDGIDLWGHAMGGGGGGGGWRWLDRGDGIELWGRAMGARNWIGVMELIRGGEPRGCTTLTRSGRWDWFMWARNGGARHWLDRGDGIDSWGRAKWQSNMVAEFKWQYHVSSCLALRYVWLVKGLVDANWWVGAWGAEIRQWDDGAVPLTY